ncbi:hypothetical protein ACJX0J_035595, partial [Zea mays]
KLVLQPLTAFKMIAWKRFSDAFKELNLLLLFYIELLLGVTGNMMMIPYQHSINQ